ncbi:PAS domain-containing protein [Marinomonas sp. 2405UD68-3]|uniref:PAS domain-containing protein n=1 Tax=Marinomonas sp. 2405UD68-3 TaxID=3391835 RepID=UPI0039C91BED
MQKILDRYMLVAHSYRVFFPDLTEVVIHNLIENRIHYIENAFTARRVGDDSLLDTENYENEMNDDGLIGPYVKFNPDGSKLKSLSLLIRDDDGQPIGLMCLNMRVDGLELASRHLQRLISSSVIEDQPILKNDWREMANRVIANTLSERKVALSHCKKTDRFAIIKALNDADIFLSRGSSDYVTEALSISRASFYQLLKAVKQD